MRVLCGKLSADSTTNSYHDWYIQLSTRHVRECGRIVHYLVHGQQTKIHRHYFHNGSHAEVIDLRVLRPLDVETIFNSIKRTHCALLVEEAWGSVNVSSEVSARIMENVFYELDAPVRRLGGVEVPIPYPKHLEDASIPQKEDIINIVKKMLQHDRI